MAHVSDRAEEAATTKGGEETLSTAARNDVNSNPAGRQKRGDSRNERETNSVSVLQSEGKVRIVASPRSSAPDRDSATQDRKGDTNSDTQNRSRDGHKSREDDGSGPSQASAKARQEQALWDRLESIMTAKQSHVQRVLEEFGIADVPLTPDLEEQVWRVVQGELNLQEAADLV